MKNRQCLQCGKEFKPYKGDHVFCCESCCQKAGYRKRLTEARRLKNNLKSRIWYHGRTDAQREHYRARKRRYRRANLEKARAEYRSYYRKYADELLAKKVSYYKAKCLLHLLAQLGELENQLGHDRTP